MTTWTHRCLIVEAAIAEQCRTLAASTLGEAQAAGMWITPLSPTGALPATHFVSVGLMYQSFADMLASPEALSEGTGIPLEQATAVLAMADVSEDAAFVAFERLGLKMVTAEEPQPS